MSLMQTLKSYLELSKVRMIPMVLVVATYGFFLAGAGRHDLKTLIYTLIGMSFVSAGSGALNNFLEIESDTKMRRTQNRVLPSGKISPLHALVFGMNAVMFGVFVLVMKVNLLTGFLLLVAAFLYVLVYTPMKRWSTWNTFVGAIPGAIPAMAGWTAATGQIEAGAWVLFLILFTWQHPHFYAIAILHEEDYRLGGHMMLPVVEPDRISTNRQIIVYSILLILVSMFPVSLGLMTGFYLIGALILGISMLAAGVLLCWTKEVAEARTLFKTSLVYLPALLLVIMIDFGWLQ